MSPEVVRRAIDPFLTNKRIGQGTGLGLSMIYGFVKQSHGHLRLHLISGKGAMVQVYLPRHAAGGSKSEIVEETKPAGKVENTTSILLVENEKVVRTLLTEVMQSLG